MPSVITHQQLDRALALRDLSDPAAGAHAMQLVAGAIGAALEGSGALRCSSTGRPGRHDPDNYDVSATRPAAPPATRATRATSARPRCCARTRPRWCRGARRALAGSAPTTSCWRARASSIGAMSSIACTSASRTRSTCGGSPRHPLERRGDLDDDDRARRRARRCPARRWRTQPAVAPVHDARPPDRRRDRRRVDRDRRVRARRAGVLARRARLAPGSRWGSGSTGC